MIFAPAGILLRVQFFISLFLYKFFRHLKNAEKNAIIYD